MDLKGKCVLLGVTGGIAAYKMANVASALRKLGADVEVIMTKNATQFITPITFETLTGHKCMVDTFDRDFKFEVTHISLAKKADVILVAPATANVIAKMAHGIADDMLTTVVLAAKCPKLVSPAMNTGMLENPITQDNLATLERYGFTVIPSESGVLACKDVGSGRLPKEDVLIEYILHTIARPKDLAGVRVTVTAGPTQEALDPVRYLTNHSTGKMGYALARAAAMRGADVTLIHGETALPPVKFTTDVPVTTAQDLYEAVTDHRCADHGRRRGGLPPGDRGQRQDQEKGRRPVHPGGAHAGHSGHHRPSKDPPVPVWFFHGDERSCGKLLRQAGKEESGHGGGQ